MSRVEELYHMLKSNLYFQYFRVKEQYERRDMSREELLELYRKENERQAAYMEGYENPFMNIMNYEDKLFSMFSRDDSIVVQEKIDGCNAHLKVLDDTFKCYGNRYILNEYHHLQG